MGQLRKKAQTQHATAHYDIIWLTNFNIGSNNQLEDTYKTFKYAVGHYFFCESMLRDW